MAETRHQTILKDVPPLLQTERYHKQYIFHPFISICRRASHCFPIEKASRQYFTHMIARPLINKTIKIGKQPEAQSMSPALRVGLYTWVGAGVAGLVGLSHCDCLVYTLRKQVCPVDREVRSSHPSGTPDILSAIGEIDLMLN